MKDYDLGCGMSKRYKVWSDSDSAIDIDIQEFDDLDEACEFASDFVHKYDGSNAKRVILNIDDNETEETIDVYEYINKCNFNALL